MTKVYIRNDELELEYIQINSISKTSSLYQKLYSRILQIVTPPVYLTRFGLLKCNSYSLLKTHVSPDRISLLLGLQGKQDLLPTYFPSLILCLIDFVTAETHAL